MSAIGNMQRSSAYHQSKRLRPPSDKAFLDQVAHRLAAAACLPLATARRRVQQLAVSAIAKPGRPSRDA
jgi:hypothetical protein